MSLLVNIFIYCFFFLEYTYYENPSSLFYDLRINFFKAIEAFLSNPTELYIYNTSINIFNFFPERAPFRSLPALLFYFLPFYYLSSNNYISGFICSFYLIIWNLFSCYLINAIVKNETFKNQQGSGYFKNAFILMSIYLLSMNQMFNYAQAQTNIIAGFFVLAGIYFYYQKKEHLTYLVWSIAGIFKIFALVLIPFFILQGPFKKFVKNACYAVIPQVPNLIMFAIWPNWIHDIWASNWGTVVGWAPFLYDSGAIGRVISLWFSVPIIPLTIFFFCLIFPPNLWITYKNRELSFIDRIMLAFLTIILCIPDLVGNDNLILLGAYVLWISSKSSVMIKRNKVLMGIPTVSAIASGQFNQALINIPYLSFVSLSMSFVVVTYYVVCLGFIYTKILKNYFNSRRKILIP